MIDLKPLVALRLLIGKTGHLKDAAWMTECDAAGADLTSSGTKIGGSYVSRLVRMPDSDSCIALAIDGDTVQR